MVAVTIVPECPGSPTTTYRAVAGDKQAFGRTAGEALDELASQLDPVDSSTIVVLHHGRPDRYFTRAEQERLEDLMTRWRAARDSGGTLAAAEQTELDTLVQRELQAAVERTRAMLEGLAP